MKVLISLISLCITFSLCHGHCLTSLNKLEFVNGKMVAPDGCIDLNDGTKHPFGDVWNSAHCMRCSCGRDSMGCCARYGGIAIVEGCKGEVDPETCKYKFYDINDPTKLCPNPFFQ